MKKSKHLIFLVAMLFFIGFSIFFYKLHYLNFPLMPNTSTLFWHVETKLDFTAVDDPVKLSLNIPKDSNEYLIRDEIFYAGKYGVTQFKGEPNRKSVWTTRKANGPQTLFYQAVVQPVNVFGSRKQRPEGFLLPYDDKQIRIGNDLIKDIKAISADNESFVLQLLKKISQPSDKMDDFDLLVPEQEGARSYNKLLLAYYLLAMSEISSDIVHGVTLQEGSNKQLKSWLQVFLDGNEWELFDLKTASLVDKSEVLILWEGEETDIATLEGGKDLMANVTVQPKYISPLSYLGDNTKGHWIGEYSFFNLPLATQNVYRLLLAIPIGVLLLIFLRNIIGFQTFGTFMPILIAISFRETQLVAGLILFSMITCIGLAARFYFEQLKLLMVPRLGSVMIVVLLFMGIISLLSYKLGIGIGLSLALFPMVIIVMTIERMNVVWEERGGNEALKQGAGTLLVAAACYGLMNIEFIRHLFFVFPELLLVILAVTLLLGRYTGYRLTELVRFREFVKG
ncbi:MAG: UUP1 family membrane protein [Cellvibrionaceae bacterium]